jgi:hypothetical protein
MLSNREAQNLDNWITGHHGEDQFRGLSDVFCADCPHESECGRDAYCNSEEEKKVYLRSIQEVDFSDDKFQKELSEEVRKLGKYIYECPTHGRFFFDKQGEELGCDYCGMILSELICFCEDCDTRTSVKPIVLYFPRCINCGKEVKVYKEEEIVSLPCDPHPE